MNNSLNENHATADVDNWYFDGIPPVDRAVDTEIVTGHLAARTMERRVVLGCAFVGLIGVAILLAVVAGSTSEIGTAKALVS